MKDYIYCKTTAKATQSYYLVTGEKQYYLFSRDFRKSNKNIFRNGVYLSDLYKMKKHHSYSVRHIVEQVIACIKYLEKEYGFTALDCTKRKQSNPKATKERIEDLSIDEIVA